MKITETVERECCKSQDLKPMVTTNYYFCVHCGNHWKRRATNGPNGRIIDYLRIMPNPDKPASPWVSVSDRLPDDRTLCFVATAITGNIPRAYRVDRYLCSKGDWESTPWVTHWMPIVEPEGEGG